MSTGRWQVFIDVGGTFTDVVAYPPFAGSGDAVAGSAVPIVHKLLSSGVSRGTVGAGSDAGRIVDPQRREDPAGFWDGATIVLLDGGGEERSRTEVARFDAAAFRLARTLPSAPPVGTLYQLETSEEAVIRAARFIMKLSAKDRIGPVEMRLGTTRGTNALLERRGAKTALVTTAGFGEILQIGNQDRPALFDLHIRKPQPVASVEVEIDERTAADGTVLRALDPGAVLKALRALRQDGIECLAICLLNALANPAHEERIAELAGQVGFEHVSVSSSVSPLPKLVSRADTTVVDAYLAPVMRRYVADIRRALPDARLRLMTSAGGLVEADQFVAKDGILSGPAGGVVGLADVARRCGFGRAIGFDMGGTSTDVSRFDGQYEYQFETVKAGVRIASPMLAIETVAAGGGSVCDFDGIKLTVGPRSAGAAPGPACYGNGGPLTVTDANLLLGRIVPEFFPFPLHPEAAQRRADELVERVAGATGETLSRHQLAEGLVRIANGNMVAAIHKISLSRGYDVRDDALVSFGGAGPQHACAVARALGIGTVVLSPLAGVLSAYGTGIADAKRIAECPASRRYDAGAASWVEKTAGEMLGPLREALRAEGIAEQGIRPARLMLDLRYHGQDHAVTVAGAPGDDFASEFERLHRRLYGYVHAGRDVELVTLRVELSGSLPRPPVESRPVVDRQPAPTSTRSIVFDGHEQTAGIFRRGDLRPGDRLTGPAMVIDDHATIMIDPGWGGAVNGTGDIILTDFGGPAPDRRSAGDAEAVALELFNNRFVAIAEQMGTTLRRTALSTNVKERLDFSCAVFTGAGDLVANAPHLPVHLGSMGHCLKTVIRETEHIAPGDVIVTNDPYHGGSHLPDVTVATPVFDEAGGERLFFVASRAHHAEIGGRCPGSMPPDSTCLAEEGVLIRHFKVVDAGWPHTDELRALLTAGPYPSRSPSENIADINAQIAANQTGAHRLRDMVRTHGRDVVLGHMEGIRSAAERKMRAALARIPDGAYRRTEYLDDGSPIAVTITIVGHGATIDFRGTGAVLKGNLNANRAITTSAVLYCFRCLIEEDIPLNDGVLAPLRIVLPEGLLNPPANDDPARCAAVAGGNVETSQRVVDTVFGALGVVAASQGTMNNLLLGNERFGYYETIAGGSGAGPGFDGTDAVHTHMTNTRQTDPEVLEARYPLRVRRLAVRRDSGGAGRHRGGAGLIREIEFLEPLDVSIISQRRTTQPYGLSGGAPGAVGRNLLRRAGMDTAEELPGVVSFRAAPGDVLTIETPGGGGYGPPRGR